jgi:4-hydroxybenzoate polyprenyltransferase
LQTRIPERVLLGLAAVSIGAAVGIGVVGAVLVNPWIGAFVAAGAFIVVAYNLELFGGRFHGDAWFALAWGAFPLLTGFFAAAEELDAAAILGAAFAFALSLAQRRLSSRVRDVRRRVSRVTGTVERRDGSSQELTAADLMDAEEGALRVLAAATIALAAALVMMQVW